MTLITSPSPSPAACSRSPTSRTNSYPTLASAEGIRGVAVIHMAYQASSCASRHTQLSVRLSVCLVTCAGLTTRPSKIPPRLWDAEHQQNHQELRLSRVTATDADMWERIFGVVTVTVKKAFLSVCIPFADVTVSNVQKRLVSFFLCATKQLCEECFNRKDSKLSCSWIQSKQCCSASLLR